MRVFAYCGVHDDMCSQIGGAMSFGYGIAHHSFLHKNSIQISTEAELVGRYKLVCTVKRIVKEFFVRARLRY